MNYKEERNDYWFKIEPYVHVSWTNKGVLLYNTLDGVIIKSDKIPVIKLLYQLLQKENAGVILLTNDIYQNEDVKMFVKELRDKYMGDIINVNLSNGKPVQLLPVFNYVDIDSSEIYKKHNFYVYKNVFEELQEIGVCLDQTTDIMKLITFLQTLPDNLIFNIEGDIGCVKNNKYLHSYFDQIFSLKNVICFYKEVVFWDFQCGNNFVYKIRVDCPIDMDQWDYVWRFMNNRKLSYEYIFEITCLEDCIEIEQLLEKYRIEKYEMKPIYTGDNLQFFKENVFLTEEDILSVSLSIKDFFIHHSINVYDYGKINIMPNGDVYANKEHPVLGNIYKDTINEIIQKEVKEGQSWFRIRNQFPCCDCIYQWHCPSPSSSEIAIGISNLCHVYN